MSQPTDELCYHLEPACINISHTSLVVSPNKITVLRDEVTLLVVSPNKITVLRDEVTLLVVSPNKITVLLNKVTLLVVSPNKITVLLNKVTPTSKRTTPGIPTWSPTVVLTGPDDA